MNEIHCVPQRLKSDDEFIQEIHETSICQCATEFKTGFWAPIGLETCVIGTLTRWEAEQNRNSGGEVPCGPDLIVRSLGEQRVR